MRKSWKKFLAFCLVITMFLGVYTDFVTAETKTKKQVTKTDKKKKTGLRFKKGLAKDFGRGFGEVNLENGGDNREVVKRAQGAPGWPSRLSVRLRLRS